MDFVFIGSLSFICFYLFDYFNNRSNKALKIFSGLSGLIIILYGTIGITFFSEASFDLGRFRWLFLGLSILFLMCLVYSLFLELPFAKTYGGEEFHKGLVKTGTYGLCRHPGVLWFFFMYMFYALYLGSVIMLIGCLVWTGLDAIYVLLQERYFFIKNFEDYEEYIKSTPMLIPNKKTIKAFIRNPRI